MCYSTYAVIPHKYHTILRTLHTGRTWKAWTNFTSIFHTTN